MLGMIEDRETAKPTTSGPAGISRRFSQTHDLVLLYGNIDVSCDIILPLTRL